MFRRLSGYNNSMIKEDAVNEDAVSEGISHAAPRRFVFVTAEAALAFAGAGVAGSIWQADRVHQDLPCTSDGGCAIVAASAWSHVDLIVLHQVPVALLGLLGYVLLLSLAMLRLGSDSPRLDRILHGAIALVSAGGFGYSWYLQWIAYDKIGATCLWCRASALLMTLLFFTAVGEWRAGLRPGQRRQEHD